MRIYRCVSGALSVLLRVRVYLACLGAGCLSACHDVGPPPPLPPPLPTVETTGSTVPSINATVRGTINPNGSATYAWFEWGTSSDTATFSATARQSLGSGTTGVPISAPLLGLRPVTTHYYRAAASNSAGTTRGAILKFTTPESPAIETRGVTFTSTNATVSGLVNPDGLATNAWFEWGASNDPTKFGLTTPRSVGSGTSSVPISSDLTGLSPDTTFYYRAAASSSAGTTKGVILSFTTPPRGAPTVETRGATFTRTSATVTANVNPEGLPTNGWFEWGTSGDLANFSTTPSQPVGSGATAVAVHADLAGLNPGTTHYYRAAASSSADTVNGVILSFTTAPSPTAAFESVSAGGYHTCGRTTIGSLFCWGDNLYGELGNDSAGFFRDSTPAAVVGGQTFAMASAGFYFTCAVTPDHSAYCWGENSNGQLGDGSTTNRSAPVVIAGGHSFTAVSAGAVHACGVTVDSTAYCWGEWRRRAR